MKRTYEAPKLTKVRLVVANAVLAVCHSSPTMTPWAAPAYNCKLATACFESSP